MTTAYVYKWTHLPTLKWYVGSRTRKNCHPNEKYICSSKIVKPLILANPNEWTREIIATGDPEEMSKLEGEILQTFDAKNDPRSFNQHNNNGYFNSRDPDTRKKISEVRRAKYGCDFYQAIGKKISDTYKQDPSILENNRKKANERWSDPEERKKASERRKKYNIDYTPELRASFGRKGVKKDWVGLPVSCLLCTQQTTYPNLVIKHYNSKRCKDAQAALHAAIDEYSKSISDSDI